MSLLLNVKYENKDRVKNLGARWNPELKKWYVKDRNDYSKFIKWILEDEEEAYIIHDHYYLVLGKRKCFKCNKMTTVVGFGIEDYAEVFNPEVYKEESPIVWNSGVVHIVPFIHNLPICHYEYFKDKYYFSKDYSRTINDYYFANHCEHCKALQGNYFLFNEVDSPFYIIDTDDARELDLLRINLNDDIVTELEPRYSDTDPLIKQFANIQELSL